MSLSDQLQKHWHRVDAVSILLLPLSLIYWLAIGARRWAYAVGVFKVHRFPVPVVVVGNLTVGGTGKTPFVIALAEQLVRLGWRPGLVSRGYRGELSQATMVPPDGTPGHFGDEPVLISQKTGLPVVVARKRAEGVKRLLQESVDIVVSDDGLQHWAMGRCAEIALVDGEEGFGNGFLLPAGPLREPSSRLATIDIRVRRGAKARAGEYSIDPCLGSARNLVTGEETALAQFQGQPVVGIAGIHRPGRFFGMLKQQGLNVSERKFPDHHRFLPDDIPAHTTVLMTEKDAVKCGTFAKENWWVVPLLMEIPETLMEDLERLIDKR